MDQPDVSAVGCVIRNLSKNLTSFPQLDRDSGNGGGGGLPNQTSSIRRSIMTHSMANTTPQVMMCVEICKLTRVSLSAFP